MEQALNINCSDTVRQNRFVKSRKMWNCSVQSEGFLHEQGPHVNPTVSLPRFWPLFLLALLVRTGVVALGIALGTLPPDLRPRDDPASVELREQILASSARAIEPWYHWDAGWYVDLAKNGYAHPASAERQMRTAFLPALPACMAAAIALGINPYWSGLLAANLAAAAGIAVFARLAAALTEDRGTGLRAYVLLQAYPAALFLSAPYNEAFGLLFTTLALQAWLQRRPIRAGLFATLCSLSRLTGISLGVAAIASWLLDDRGRSGLLRAVLFALGSFLGLILFWAYLGWAVGDPLVGLKVQEYWGRKSLSPWNPWYSVCSIVDRDIYRHGEAFEGLGFAVEAGTALMFSLLGLRAWMKRGAFWGIVTLVPIAQLVMSGSFLSTHRLLLAGLPAFIEMAELMRNRLVFRVFVTVFVCLQFVLLNRFAHWRFAG